MCKVQLYSYNYIMSKKLSVQRESTSERGAASLSCLRNILSATPSERCLLYYCVRCKKGRARARAPRTAPNIQKIHTAGHV